MGWCNPPWTGEKKMDVNPEGQESNQVPEDSGATLPPGRIEFRPETQFRGNAALVVQTDRAEINRGAALVVVGNEVSITQGGCWITAGREVEIEQGGCQWIIAGEVEVEQGGAGIMIARDVEAQALKAGIVLAGSITGNVQTLLDKDGALRLGIGLGTMLGISMLIRRLIR